MHKRLFYAAYLTIRHYHQRTSLSRRHLTGLVGYMLTLFEQGWTTLRRKRQVPARSRLTPDIHQPRQHEP